MKTLFLNIFTTISAILAIIIMIIFSWAKWYGITYLISQFIPFELTIWPSIILTIISEMISTGYIFAKKKNENRARSFEENN